MTRPADIPQDVWEATEPVGETIYGRHERGWVIWPLVQEREIRTAIARAILAATEAERERCAGIADAYAEVNWQTCTDTILLDPVLSNRGQRSLTAADWAKAEGMAVDGTVHSSMYHAATNIAAAIRKATP